MKSNLMQDIGSSQKKRRNLSDNRRLYYVNSFFCNGPGALGTCGEARASDAPGAQCHGGQDLLAQLIYVKIKKQNRC